MTLMMSSSLELNLCCSLWAPNCPDWASSLRRYSPRTLDSNKTCFSISLKLPPWKQPKLPTNPFNRTGLLAIVAIMFGMNPNFSSSVFNVGLDFFGA